MVLDSTGATVDPGTIARIRRTAKVRALAGDGTGPYDAADWTSQEMSGWNAYLQSPDLEINPRRDTIVARVRDLVRNDGWAAGTVTSILDSAIGADFRLNAKPDWRYLKLNTSAAFDAVWADEFGQAAEALWRSYAYDPGHWCDSARALSVPGLLRVAFRHELVDGESISVLNWVPERVGPGRASYATSVQLVDPDRLSNPQLMFDTPSLRGGVEIDAYGAADAYHIRRAHQGDWFDAAKSVIWDRVPRETTEGRPVVIHNFERERAGQHRSAGGIFTPVLARMMMLAKYDKVELQAAVVNAIFSAYIESPFDADQIADSLSENTDLPAYQAQRAEFHGSRKLSLGGVRIPTLFPGEKMVSVDAKRPISNFEAFESAVLRNLASAAGTAAEEITKDWAKMNYSGARTALMASWKTLIRRRDTFAAAVATPIYCAWLEEADSHGELPMPAGAPDFIEARYAYSACRWMGRARGWIDPLKEMQGSVLGMDAGLTTLEQECFEQGLDWEEVVAQRAIEAQRFKDLKLPPLQWMNQPADIAAEKPERPEAE